MGGGILNRPARWCLLLLAVLLLALAAPTPPIRLIVCPQVAFAPAEVSVRVRLVPDASDRELLVEMDSGDFRRASAQTIDGEQTPRLLVFAWRDVPAGEYTIRAIVGNPPHIRASAVTSIRILAIH